MTPLPSITLSLTPQAVELVLFALGKLPFEQVANTYLDVRAQRNAIMQKMQANNVVPINPAPKASKKGDT